MDPVLNPYSPGAGHRPPVLAGRDDLRQRISIAIARIKAGRAAKSVLMVGLQGIGKILPLFNNFMRRVMPGDEGNSL